MVDDVAKYRRSEIKDRNIDELLGVCRGVLADDLVVQKEAEFIYDWILKHFTSSEISTYPLNTIFDRLQCALSDGVLDNKEAEDLKVLLQNFTGDKPIYEQVKSLSSTLPLCNPAPNVLFDGYSFCMTGAFTIGTRATCEKILKELGATVHKTPVRATDYLVIGYLGSEAWIHSSYGRKIEKAVELRERKNGIMKIITEEHLIKFF